MPAGPVWAPLSLLQRVTRSRVSQVYHSEVPSEGEPHACGCALLPLNTTTRGPAKRTEGAAQHGPCALKPVGSIAAAR